MLTKANLYFFAVLTVILITLQLLHLIPLGAALLVLAFTLVLAAYKHFLPRELSALTYVLWLLAMVLGVGVGLYRPAEFNYPSVFNVEALLEGGLAFNLYINTAKLLAGYIIIFLLISNRKSTSVFIQSRVNQMILAVVLGLVVVGVASQVLGLSFYPKELHYVLLFGLVNLLVTCVSEEAFMRLLLQSQLQGFLARRIKSVLWLEAIPLLVATLIFILTHSVSNLNMIVAFGFAGFTYGLVYSLTKNVWACVTAHFVVNIVHFALLTYPLAK